MIKKISLIVAILLLFSVFSVSGETLAEDISNSTTFSGSSFSEFSFLTDKRDTNFKQTIENGYINISSQKEIGSVYIIFKTACGEYILTDTESGKSAKAGTNGFMHEFIDVSKILGDVTNIKIEFQNKAILGEIYVFSKGGTPEFVQKWDKPLENDTDLLLFATHGDDDQLYFAGILPHFAVDKGFKVQVAYLTDHYNGSSPRTYEMLNGLWAVGIRNYPVFGHFADFRIDDKEKTYKEYERLGTTKDDLLGYTVEQIRRFKPLVTIGHDFKGEYGHGMHQVYADLVANAITLSADKTAFQESADKYGTWTVQKAYFHLYNQNPITLNLDEAKDCFGGLSAFQMTQKYGFPAHKSQQNTFFKPWLNGKNGEITKATQIIKYNPAQYGLYFTNVGNDNGINDMFENVEFRKEEVEEKQETLPPKSDGKPKESNKGKIFAISVIVLVVLLALTAISLILYNQVYRWKRRHRR